MEIEMRDVLNVEGTEYGCSSGELTSLYKLSSLLYSTRYSRHFVCLQKQQLCLMFLFKDTMHSLVLTERVVGVTMLDWYEVK